MKKKGISTEKILGFLRSKGIHLSEEAKRIFEKKLEENPIDDATFHLTKKMGENKLLLILLDLAFTKRIKDRASTPLLQLFDQKRKENKKGTGKEQMQERTISQSDLQKIFYDEKMWELYSPVLQQVGEGGIIVKVIDKGDNKPYIGLLRLRNLAGFQTLTLITTVREKFWNLVSQSQFWKLKDHSDPAMKKYVGDIEAEFIKYIFQRQERKISDN